VKLKKKKKGKMRAQKELLGWKKRNERKKLSGIVLKKF
jgi:hypothetical protein